MTAPVTKNEDDAYGLLRELTDIVREETGLKESIATQIAQCVLDGLRKKRGGDPLYVPSKLTAQEREARDIDICRRLNRNNAPVLAKEYGLTTRQVYRIYHKRKRPHKEAVAQ